LTAAIATRLCGSEPKDPQADAVLLVTMLDLTTSGIAIVRKPLLDCEHTRTVDGEARLRGMLEL